MTSTARPMTVTLGLGTAQLLAWGSTYYLPAILAVPMARDLGISASYVFAAFSAALIVAAVLGPLVGRRIDFLGGRHVLVASSVFFAAGLAFLGTAQSGLTLILAWLLIGVGMATGLYEAAFSTLTGIYGQKARAAITGITLLGGLASTVCWPISAYLEVEYGWRIVCFSWAAAHLVIGLPLNWFLVPTKTRTGPGSAEGNPAAAHHGKTQFRAMALLSFVFAVTWFTSTAMAAHLPQLLQSAGATATLAIGAAALVGPAQVAGRLLEYGLLQKFHPLLSARLAALAHPVGAGLLLTIGAPVLFLFPLLHGAGNGVLTIAMGTLPLATFGPLGYGLRQGLMMVPARFAQATAPFLFGILLERFGTSALLLSTILGLAAFIALLYLKPAHATSSH